VPRAKAAAEPSAKPARRHTGGVPAHVPTKESRGLVTLLAGFGVPQPMICRQVGPVTEKTLRRHYATELALGAAQATSKVAETLYKQATSGANTAATIFWLKVRAGWSEKVQVEGDLKASGSVEHRHSGEVSVVMTAEQRAAILAAVRAQVRTEDDEGGGGGGASGA
jgi:hypothetical protein